VLLVSCLRSPPRIKLGVSQFKANVGKCSRKEGQKKETSKSVF
jgi:hypothetical protein